MDAGTNRPATTIDTSPIPAETSSFPDTGADHRVALGSGVTSGYHGATSSMTPTSLTPINLVRHVFFRFPILLLALWLLPPATLRAEEPLHDLVDRLMGTNPAHRFAFIQENAAAVDEEAIDA